MVMAGGSTSFLHLLFLLLLLSITIAVTGSIDLGLDFLVIILILGWIKDIFFIWVGVILG